jgi:hypothetical protein
MLVSLPVFLRNQLNQQKSWTFGHPVTSSHAEQQLDQVVSPVEFFLVEMLSCPSFGMKTPLQMAKNQTKIRKQH